MTNIDALDDPQALQQLVSQLSHHNANIKIAALRQAIAFQDKAPLKPILNALLDKREDVHGTATETVGALKPWITDEQWLETLQRPLLIIYQVALAILETQGQEAPTKPVFRASCSPNSTFRAQAQRLLAMQAQHWSTQKVIWFIGATTKNLQLGTPTARMIALEMLGVLGDKAPLELLLQSLQDDNVDVRYTALEQLTAQGRQGRELLIEPITALINDPSPRIRRSVLCTLRTQDNIPLGLFITALQDPDERVRQSAALYLGKRRDIQTVPALLQFLLQDTGSPYQGYVDSAMTALGELYGHIPIETLINALSSSQESVRLQAIKLLGSLKERTPVKLLLELLEHKDAAMRREALYELGLGRHWEHFSVETIINKLRDTDEKVRRTARYVLLTHNAEISSDLLFPLLDCTEGIALVAVMEQLNTRLPIKWLIAATHNENREVRTAAIEILGRLDEQAPLDILLDALKDPERIVQQAGLSAMRSQCYRLSIESLKQALQDTSDQVRLIAIQSIQIREHKEPFIVETLFSLLQDSNYSIRDAAIQTLIQWDVTEPIEAFVTSLADETFTVRESAFNALMHAEKRVPSHLIKAQIGDSNAYQFAIKYLQQTHPEVFGEVVEEASNILLGQGAGELIGSIQQAYIARVIGNIPNPGPLLVSKLIELLDWPHPKVRMTAAQALDKHNPLQLEIQA
ncbi:hypothetical protein KSD_68650 [Ktedonobacter sp. SOSP1-85]|uniref:HEAT repeat domain-containing protein n=1 Tax=Ktedonobacter sp. SOSP1-85 TaxID=2778367 RepID=UPI0019154E73|nr:HEAT repeat domain-containing protein [Ktedonobacter sp. SOSP1-85]GHO79094.1 hypothetical protein KSD_68650 [Ktedonobacter sp. SOSP1-85]